MKKFKLFWILFILYVYENYIKEDWTVITKRGKTFFFIPWVFRSILMWAICPVFLPEFLFKRSKMYTEFQKHLKTYQKQSS